MQPVDRISSVDFPQTVLKNIECHLPLFKEAGSTLTQGSSASFPYGARQMGAGGSVQVDKNLTNAVFKKLDSAAMQASSHARVHPVNHVLLGLRKHPSH